jgi:hypothetical protein
MFPKILYLLALTLALQACGSKSSADAQNTEQGNASQNDSSNSSETNSLAPQATETSPSLERYKGMQSNTWYKGEIGGNPIWLYTGSGSYGDYGYESSNGAHISINIKKQGSNFTIEHSSYPKGQEYKETFAGKEDPSTGRIEGKWSNSKGKSSPFWLEPLTVKAQNAKELLDDLHLIKTPSKIEKYIDYKNAYKDKKAARLVHNLSAIIPKTDMGGGQNLAYRDEKSLFLGKVALPNERWLVFYTANSAEDLGEYSTDNIYCAAIFDKEGKLLNTLMLGSHGTDPYYQEMIVEAPSPTKIVCTTVHFFRGDGGARMEDESATTKRSISIKGDRFAE